MLDAGPGTTQLPESLSSTLLSDPTLPTKPVRRARGSPASDFFKRVWKKHFSGILGFAKFHRHSECNTCAELRARLAAARTPAERAAVLIERLEHNQEQMADRHVYYKVRDLARSGSMLVIIMDGTRVGRG